MTLIVYESWSLILERYIKGKMGINRTECGKEVVILLFFAILAFSGNLIIFVIGYCLGALLLVYKYRKHRRNSES